MSDTQAQDYALGYSESETSRLDIQHNVIVTTFEDSCLSEMTRRAAREGRIRTVLDLATGTGSWAIAALKELTELSPHKDIKVVGVDIAANEEWASRSSVPFEQASIFDDEALAAIRAKHTDGVGFDLVHVRHVTIVIPAAEWQTTAHSFASLVKTGGLLQHEEGDVQLTDRNSPHGSINLLFQRMGVELFLALGKSTEVGPSLVKWYSYAGLTPLTDSIATHLSPRAARKVGLDERRVRESEIYGGMLLGMISSQWAKAVAPAKGLSAEQAQEAVQEMQQVWDHAQNETKDLSYVRMVTGVKSVFASNKF